MAEGFSERLRDEAAQMWERIFEHPFLVEMKEGKLPIEKFRFYIKQDYAYLMDFARCLGLAAAKARARETMSAFASLLEASLTVEIEMLEELAEEIGVSVDDLRASEQAPTNTAYVNHLLLISYSCTVGEIMAAMLPCMWTYQLIGEILGGAHTIRGHPIYSAWCETYRSKEYIELVDWYRNLTDRYADESGPSISEKMRKHFMLSSRYEYMFWDMAYKMEEWPT